MAADEPKSPLKLLWAFCVPENKPLVIDQLEAIEVKEQLELLNVAKISTNKDRAARTKALFDKVPELRDCAHKRIRLKSALSHFHRQYLSTMDTAPGEWDQKQISFSFFVFLMERLRRSPADDADQKDYDKDWKSADASWMFIHYLHRYCKEQQWGGRELLEYFNEITLNGQKTNGFALKAAKKICTEYKLKLGKYARVRKQLPIWYTEALERGKQAPAVVEEKKENDPPQKVQPAKGSTTTTATTAATAATATPKSPTKVTRSLFYVDYPL